MRKSILYIIIILVISCSSNKKFTFEQRECLDCSVKITFLRIKDNMYKGNIILNKTIEIKNPYVKYSSVRLHYFQKGILNEFSHPLYLDKNNKYQFFEQIDYNHTIPLYPMENKNFYYQLWIDIDSINFLKQHKSLEQYKNLVTPIDVSNVITNNPINKNIFSYEEPFSEFKRKNPELLEFLTKGDTIELEVISPVKQKYRFKAEW